jgi:hypothetical protein
MGLGLMVFIGSVALIYFLANYYIYRHISPLCQSSLGKVVLILFVLAMIAYPSGRLLQAFTSLEGIAKISAMAGSYYFAFMAYAFLLSLFIDIYRLMSSLFSFMPLLDVTLRAHIWRIGVVIMMVLIVIGSINARRTRTVALNLEMPNANATLDSIRAVAVSDVHVGLFMNNSRIKDLVSKINDLSPDMVLFVGDIVDESVSVAMEESLAEELKQLNAPLGVYAVAGNHEYYAGIEEVEKYLARAGVKLLQDEFAIIENSLILVGRKDITANRMERSKRIPLNEILQEVPKDLPVMVLDHTPVNLDETASQGAAIQLSGHTHNGQMWPFNLITKLIFEKSWGLLQKDNTLIYVSSGYGTWGPPVRLGSMPEIILLNLRFINSVQGGSE